MSRVPLPSRRRNTTVEIMFDMSPFSICVGFDDAGTPREAFCDGPREGSQMQAIVADACVLISIALQNGLTPAELGKSLGRTPRWTPKGEADAPASIIGAVIEVLGALP